MGGNMNKLLILTLEPLKNVFARIASIVPNLLAMAIILCAGVLIAAAVRAIAHMLLTAAGFDRWSERTGFASLLKKADVWASPSQAIGLSLYWFLLLASLLASLTALNAAFVDTIISGILAYVPEAPFGRVDPGCRLCRCRPGMRGLLISLVNSGFGSARHYARAVRILLFVVLAAMALEQLNIARESWYPPFRSFSEASCSLLQLHAV